MPTVMLFFNRLICRIIGHKFIDRDVNTVICRRCRGIHFRHRVETTDGAA